MRMLSVVYSPQFFLPDAGHEVKGHAGFEFGQVTPAKAHRTVSPVRRIAESDGVSGTAVFVDSVFFQDIEKGYRDVFTAVSRTGLFQSGFQSFQDGLVCIQKFTGGLTEEDRPAEGDMITPVATCNFKKSGFSFFYRAVIPGQVGCRGVGA